MQFIHDYLEATHGTSVPVRYNRWAAISVLAMTLGRRVYVDHGHFKIHPMLYLCLVGTPASGKSTAKDKARDLFLEAHEGFPIGASITTREAIVQRMSGDEDLKCYTDHNNTAVEFKPLYFFINEFTNFLSHNPAGMIDFLTDVYQCKFFDSGTIKHGLQPIINPCINILACDVPDKIIEKLKLSLIGGGFSRRLLFIYETELPKRKVFPDYQVANNTAWKRCVEHLQKIKTIAGPFTWDSDARSYLEEWYQSLPVMTDPVLTGYYGSKDTIVQQIAMAIAVSYSEPKLHFTKPMLEAAIAMLEANEDNLPKLTIGAGRNELAAFQARLLETLVTAGGFMLEKKFHTIASSNFSESEYVYVRNFLKGTDQIYEVVIQTSEGNEAVICTPEQYRWFKSKGGFKE